MNTDKTRTDFLRDLTNLDNLLVEFQNQYPINFGAMFRQNFGVLLMMLALILYGLGSKGGYTFCTIPSLLFVAGFIVWVKRYDLKQKEASPIDVNNKIAEIEYIYSQYPDVQAFIKKFRAKVNAVNNKKTLIRIAFWILMASVGGFGALLSLTKLGHY